MYRGYCATLYMIAHLYQKVKHLDRISKGVRLAFSAIYAIMRVFFNNPIGGENGMSRC